MCSGGGRLLLTGHCCRAGGDSGSGRVQLCLASLLLDAWLQASCHHLAASTL